MADAAARSPKWPPDRSVLRTGTHGPASPRRSASDGVAGDGQGRADPFGAGAVAGEREGDGAPVRERCRGQGEGLVRGGIDPAYETLDASRGRQVGVERIRRLGLEPRHLRTAVGQDSPRQLVERRVQRVPRDAAEQFSGRTPDGQAPGRRGELPWTPVTVSTEAPGE
ncbi:hypothetical protein [Streptomyces sp. NPDC088794]|uniref:hypothetical protein n=1 Tax=Streptomyces sp. NPDC088794 TaxID=3365902 RepID=UPI003803F257